MGGDSTYTETGACCFCSAETDEPAERLCRESGGELVCRQHSDELPPWVRKLELEYDGIISDIINSDMMIDDLTSQIIVIDSRNAEITTYSNRQEAIDYYEEGVGDDLESGDVYLIDKGIIYDLEAHSEIKVELQKSAANNSSL
jgi:hypothetical protein